MNPPSALAGAMGRERKPFSYLPGGLDLSQIKSERMAQRLMRNAMNQGVPEVPVHAIQSPTTPSTPVAVPNFSCLPVQVLPPGFSLPANPKSLLRSRSNPNREAQPKAPQFMNPQPIPQARIEQLQNNINKTAPQLPQTNTTYNNRPTSMFEYGYSPNSNTTKTSYGSDGYTAPALPEMCYDAEYLTTAPKSYESRENKEYLPSYTQDTAQPTEATDILKPEIAPGLLDTNANLTSCEPLEIRLPSNDNDIKAPVFSNNNSQTTQDTAQPTEATDSLKPEIAPGLLDTNANLTSCEPLEIRLPSNDNEAPVFSNNNSKTTELSIEPISFNTNSTVNTLFASQNVDTSPSKSIEDIAIDMGDDTKSDFIVKVPENDVNVMFHDPLESKPAEDLLESSDDQKQVKVVKKQVKKEKKVEESATNVEDRNGNQNGDNEAELVVKLPTKKSGTKVETKVEVMKKSLPDGSVEETTKTTTKTTTDGKTSIKTKTEKRIIPKEELSEEEVEEEDEDVEEEVEEEPEPVVVKANGHKEVIVKKAESTVTTSAKKVVVTQSNDQEEEEEEVAEPVTETKVVVKAPAKEEVKQVEVEETEEEEEEQVVVVKKAAPAPAAKPEPEPEQEEEEAEEEEEVVVVKKTAPVENKPVAVVQKDEEEDVEEEEEYEEAEEEVKVEAKKPEPKSEPVPEKPKEQDEESEYTEEEVESEPEEAPKPAPVKKQETEPEPKLEPKEEKPEPKGEKPEPKEEKHEEPAQAAPQPETKVPLREPSIPLEKVEDVEIKPIGEAQTVSKTHTENTEIITSSTAPASSLSTQTEYNRVENIVTVNRTTKTLDNTYEQLTQSGIPTMKTYFAPNRERVSTSPQPSKPYQSTYTPPEPPKTERRHSLLLERLSTERQMPGSEVYQNSYSGQYSNQSYEQQKQWSQQEPQSEVVNVSNVKPSTISNSQWYQQSRNENILYNNVTPTAAPPASQLWNQQPQAQPQYQQQPQAQPQYPPSYTQSTQQDYSKLSNAYQQTSYPSYTPQPSSWGNNNLSTVDTIPKINIQSNQSYSSQETQSYQKTSQQYSSSYVPPPWEQDPNYVSPATSSFFQPRTDAAQPPPTTNTFSPNTHPGWTSTLPKTKFTKPPPKAYVPPAPNQSFVKNVNIAEPPPQPGRRTYYSEYERRYITVPESNYVPADNKFQAQPDPSPQYYYDNNEQPAEPAEPQWRKELREFTEKTSQTQYQTQQTSTNPPWESEPNYEKTPTVKYTPTPSWSQTLRPQSYRERSFESELVSESQEWAKSNTLGRNRPVSSYVKSAEAPAQERPRGVSVDRFNPNNYSGPILSEHQPVQVQTLTPTNAPHTKGYHNPNVPAYHARASAEPREQPAYQPRAYALESRASPLQSRSFKYLQWITGTEE